jgi:hypothetical protein
VRAEVQVWAGGAPRRADGADRLTTLHRVALAYRRGVEVEVQGVEAEAVIDGDQAAREEEVAYEGHPS